ncbi:hypothetical protein [Bradyrhizobium sp. 76]|uniref:hypothetical protein n=1 Tax=Bradyrhizobium sp. 76 TaxID=2782680 RepID=UPI0032098BDC
MAQEFYRGIAQRVRNLAEKADPFTRRGLLDPANRYKAKGMAPRAPVRLRRPLPAPRTTAQSSTFWTRRGLKLRQTRPEELVVARTADPL